MKTINFCINIISNHLNGERTEAPVEYINWEKIIKCFKCHELIGILYYQCKDFIPDEYKILLEHQNAAAMYFYSNRNWIENKIKARLNDDGVDCFIVKGNSIASYYPRPALRTMGDTDIVVHTKDRKKVHNILLSLGFVNKLEIYSMEWQYELNDLELELHDRLLYERHESEESYISFFNDCWRYVKNGVVDWNFHFLFILYHLRRHFILRGVGLRHFVDVAVLTQKNTELDWLWIKSKLIELNMWEFSQRIFYLNSKWFGIKPPVDISDFDSYFFKKATEYIFKNGVFGFDNIDNKDNSMIKNISDSKKNSYGIGRIIRAIFPDYEVMSNMEYCKFVVGHKYLLPVAWGYRLVKIMKKKRTKRTVKEMNDIVKTSFVSGKKVKERIEFLKEWGLE